MENEKKFIIVEQVCEFAIGWAIGAAATKLIEPEGAVNKALTLVGTSAIAWTIGRKFAGEFVNVCDKVFDVDLKDRFI